MEKEYLISHKGVKIKFSLVRSQRKTIGITISKEGSVKVTAPQRATERQILEIVNKKAPWVIQKLDELEKSMPLNKKEKHYENGSMVLYLGREYELSICRVNGIKKPELELCLDKMNIKLPYDNIYNETQIRAMLREWLVRQFEAIIRDRISRFSSILGISPSKVTIREQKTRWGSCSAKGNINLNWKLIMAPLEILDYVVVHELCHMKQMNHSRKFWEVVEGIIPEFKERRKWLRTNGSKLFL